MRSARADVQGTSGAERTLGGNDVIGAASAKGKMEARSCDEVI